MNKYDTEKALKDYEAACNYIAEVFVNKQYENTDGEENITFEKDAGNLWWVGNRPGSTLCIYRDTFGFKDILTDLRQDAPVGAIFRYYDYVVNFYEDVPENMKAMSYSTWLNTESHPE